jgi:hypothetical protein
MHALQGHVTGGASGSLYLQKIYEIDREIFKIEKIFEICVLFPQSLRGPSLGFERTLTY